MQSIFPRVGAHSVSGILFHIVWATRKRMRVLAITLDEVLERELSAVAKALEVTLLAYGAADDHVHVLVQAPPEASVAMIANRLKGATSHALRSQIVVGWQAGYWAQTVSPDAVPALLLYLRDQRTHHGLGGQVEAWQGFDGGRFTRP